MMIMIIRAILIRMLILCLRYRGRKLGNLLLRMVVHIILVMPLVKRSGVKFMALGFRVDVEGEVEVRFCDGDIFGGYLVYLFVCLFISSSFFFFFFFLLLFF